MDLFDACIDETRPIRPLGLVVGGVVDPRDLIGREREVANAVEALTVADGVVLTGDRRVGKTSLTRKLEKLLTESGHDVIRVSAQTEDPKVFAGQVRAALMKKGWFRNELDRWAIDIEVSRLGMTVRRTSKKGGTVEEEDLLGWAAQRCSPTKLIVIIDELTALLSALSGDGADATEFMNRLRIARQEHANLTMVIAGSVGLHHVVPPGKGLVNDLTPMAIGALDPCDAVYLARCLMHGNGLDGNDLGLAAQIARVADAIPFYVHYLVQQLQGGASSPQSAEVRSALDAAFADPLDPLDIRHYRDRIPNYYGVAIAPAAMVALDAYAVDGPLDIDTVRARLATADLSERPGRDELIKLVEQLERDHYLLREPDDTNRFATEVLRRAWIAIRRLR